MQYTQISASLQALKPDSQPRKSPWASPRGVPCQRDSGASAPTVRRSDTARRSLGSRGLTLVGRRARGFRYLGIGDQDEFTECLCCALLRIPALRLSLVRSFLCSVCFSYFVCSFRSFSIFSFLISVDLSRSAPLSLSLSLSLYLSGYLSLSFSGYLSLFLCLALSLSLSLHTHTYTYTYTYRYRHRHRHIHMHIRV